jgi:hypothetical protein
MPFALAGFMEVEQLEPGRYRVKRYARNGQQMVGQEVTNLPEVAAANRNHGPAQKTVPQAALAPRISGVTDPLEEQWT